MEDSRKMGAQFVWGTKAVEIKELAERVLFSDSLEDKLISSECLTDECPGAGGVVVPAPARPQHLRFASSQQSAAFPKLRELENEAALVRLFHFFANHELLATELMALVLLRFPEAPKAFRRGVAKTLMDEQAHTQLYLDRMRELGGEFGAYPVSGFFWETLREMESPLEYVTGLPLTFEQANLDFSQYYANVFAQLGDQRSRRLMDRIFRDEIGHVAYGLKWLRRLKRPQMSDWEAYQSQLKMPLSPRRAKGVVFDESSRRRCGFDETFIRSLAVYSKSRGRTPNVFYFNPFAEWEWAAGRRLTLTKRQREFQLDLENLPQFLGGNDDVVLVTRGPSNAWLESLHRSGLPVPQFEYLRKEKGIEVGELSQRRVHRLMPWAWSPSAFSILASLRNVVEKGPIESSGEAETSGFLELFSKASSLTLQNEITALHKGAEIFIPESDFGRVVGDLPEALAAIDHWRGNGPRKLVAKACFGAAGGRMLRLWESSLTEQQENWLAKRFAAGERLVIEPWHDRIFDFSAHFDATAEGVRLRGFAQMLNDQRGQFAASVVGDRFTVGLPNVLKRWLHHLPPGGYKRIYEGLADPLGEWCRSTGYQGPLGVDAYVYQNAQEEWRLRPVVELNPRFTMGRIAMGLRRYVVPGRIVTFLLVSNVLLGRLSFNEFSELPTFLAAHYPLEISDSAPVRISGGAICLTDPALAVQCVAVLFVGRSGNRFVRDLLQTPEMVFESNVV